MDNLERLRVFHAVAQAESFTKAAESLHLTQSGISKHIKAMEDELGVPLFDRVGKKVSLTQAGEILYEAAHEVIALGRVGRAAHPGIGRLGSRTAARRRQLSGRTLRVAARAGCLSQAISRHRSHAGDCDHREHRSEGAGQQARFRIGERGCAPSQVADACVHDRRTGGDRAAGAQVGEPPQHPSAKSWPAKPSSLRRAAQARERRSRSGSRRKGLCCRTSSTS